LTDDASSKAPDLAVLVPVYNEQDAIVPTLERLEKSLERLRMIGMICEVVVVDDGSVDGSGKILDEWATLDTRRVIHSATNRGYGAALKKGARSTRASLIAMIDADGTYPVERLGDLIVEINQAGADMAVGARTGADVNIPMARRPAKWLLTKIAEVVAGHRIPDLNSGFRVLRRETFFRYIRLLPNGFSLTTTITLACLTEGESVSFIPINYAKRVGKSSIRPIRDTIKFLGLILRTVTMFNPMRVFGPAALLLILAGLGVGIVSKLVTGLVMDVTSIVLVLSGLQVLGIGLVAEVVARRL